MGPFVCVCVCVCVSVCVCVCARARACVCYCRERQGLASEVIRAAACLSLSLQPENTLLFRTTLTAPLPLPRRLLLSESLTGGK